MAEPIKSSSGNYDTSPEALKKLQSKECRNCSYWPCSHGKKQEKGNRRRPVITAKNPLRTILARTPVSVPIQSEYSTCLLPRHAGLRPSVYAQAGAINQKRQRCQQCGKQRAKVLQFPAQLMPTHENVPPRRRLAQQSAPDGRRVLRNGLHRFALKLQDFARPLCFVVSKSRIFHFL